MTPTTDLLIQSIGEAAFLLDQDGYITFTNPAATRLTGHSEAEFLGKHLSILYAEGDEVRAEYELNQTKKIGHFVVEGWRPKKDGTSFWSEMSFALLPGENRHATGFSLLLRDVTERKNRELDLRLSEERYRLMVEGVKDYAIFMLDAGGHIVTWNEGAKRHKGYSAYEIIGKHFSVFYTDADLKTKKPERELKIATETGKYEEEGWRVKKNGSVFWANVIITALFNEQNKLVGFSKVTRDLSDRKEKEEELRQSEERYRSLVEQVTDYGIFMLDEKGRIISWNEGAKKIKGYAADEIIGKYFSIFYPEEDIITGKPAYELKKAIKEGKYEEEGWRLRKDGSRFWANVVITAVYNKDGVLIGFSKVTRDLTERKEAERALRESYKRYREIADELRQTNGELSYANKELEQFTSIVSHDLQEPIRTIKSFLQLIELRISEGKYENLQAYISKSVGAANRMRELIQNLLHYSQLDKNDVVKTDIDVRHLVNQAVQNLRTSIENAGATISVRTDVEQVKGDPVQLLQVIQNLLSNALKFTGSDAPRIEVHCTEEDGHVKFAVSDNGIGIPAEDQHKVFEIFRRLHTGKRYPGTGIGLAICKKIIDRHGGQIWPESEPGKGTTFYFTLAEETNEKIPVP